MNTEEIPKFLETYNLLWWNYKEIENLYKSIMNKEIRLVLKKNNSQTTKMSRTMWFHWWILPTSFSHHTFKEELTPIIFKVFPKNEEEGTFLNSFYKDIKDWQIHYKKRKPEVNIFDNYRCKQFQLNTSKTNSIAY